MRGKDGTQNKFNIAMGRKTVLKNYTKMKISQK